MRANVFSTDARRMVIFSHLAIILIGAGILEGCRQAPSEGDRLNSLVAKLASPNPAPEQIDPARIATERPFGDRYDYEAQSQVREAHELLSSTRETRVLKVLLDHIDDKRYSFTDLSEERIVNLTVGDVCYDIVRRLIEPKCQYKGAALYVDTVVLPKHLRAQWWREHQGLKLDRIIEEAEQWVISAERERNTPSAKERVDCLLKN